MALPFITGGDHFMIPENIKPGKPKSGYTAVLGDLVIRDISLADGWDRCAANENVEGIVVSINSANGTLSVAILEPYVSTIKLEYIGTAPTLHQTMEAGSTPGKGTVTVTDRDVVELDDTNGNLQVRAVDTTAKTVIVQRVLRTSSALLIA